MPYLAYSDTPDTGPSGVVKYNKNKALDGYNLYTDDENAFLMDMTGQEVYHWDLPRGEEVWSWGLRILKDGSLIAEHTGVGVLKIDKNSKIIWATPIIPDHDIEILPDGTFLVQAVEPPVSYNNRLVCFDSIVHISGNGKILDKWLSYDHLKDFKNLHFTSLLDDRNKITPPAYWHQRPQLFNEDKYDYFHLNSIQILPDTPLGLKDKRFQKGNWLMSARNLDLIFILDKDTREVVWGWGPGILDGQHMPRMLNNGNILIFDNGYHRSYSRLIIMDPLSDKIVWEYKANPPESFRSKKRGSVQPLENGNFLVSESDTGRVFEITPGGEIVWEFRNPQIRDDRRYFIYRMLRIPKEEVSGWLKKT